MKNLPKLNTHGFDVLYLKDVLLVEIELNSGI